MVPIRVDEHLPPVGAAPPQTDLQQKDLLQKFKSVESESIENFLAQSPKKPEESKSMEQKLDE